LRNTEKIKLAIKEIPVIYNVFDILYKDGQDLRQIPLMDRKEVLINLFKLPHQENIRLVDWVENHGIKLFKEIESNKGEGIVAKEKTSLYLPRRSNKWLKIINWLQVEGIIYGYRKDDNALLCKTLQDKDIGIVHQGMSPQQRSAFLQISKSIVIDEDKYAVYIEPLIKCNLKCRGFTSSGLARSPIFIDFITD